MSKVLFNPTEEVVSITIDGHDYSVDPKSEIFISVDSHADRWVKTHSFLESHGTVDEPKIEVTTTDSKESITIDEVEEEVNEEVEGVEVVEEVKSKKSKK